MKHHDDNLNSLLTSVNNNFKEKRKIICSNYIKRHPFTRKMSVRIGAIKNRCNNPNDPHYSNYGGRGIKCSLSRKELEFIWKRDGAEKMIKPTVDRIDNNGHYSFNNCRIIESRKNILKGWKDATISLKEKTKVVSKIKKYLKKNKMNPYRLALKLGLAPCTTHFWLFGRKCRMKKKTVQLLSLNNII